MRITTSEGTCIGSGRCTWLLPEVFDQDADGFVMVRDESPPAQYHERVREAELSCPSRTITVDEA